MTPTPRDTPATPPPAHPQPRTGMSFGRMLILAQRRFAHGGAARPVARLSPAAVA